MDNKLIDAGKDDLALIIIHNVAPLPWSSATQLGATNDRRNDCCSTAPPLPRWLLFPLIFIFFLVFCRKQCYPSEGHLAVYLLFLICFFVRRAGGNQRELARQKNAKKQTETHKGKRNEDGLSAAARKQRYVGSFTVCVCMKDLYFYLYSKACAWFLAVALLLHVIIYLNVLLSSLVTHFLTSCLFLLFKGCWNNATEAEKGRRRREKHHKVQINKDEFNFGVPRSPIY